MNERETWLSVAEAEKISKSCADKMRAVGMKKIRLSQAKAERVANIVKTIREAKLTRKDLEKIKATI